MRLGILVTTERMPQRVAGLARAALAGGHAVRIFATDVGTRLLTDPRVSSLGALPGVTMSYCEVSLRLHGGRPEGLPPVIQSGSQLENALMYAESDKVIVL